MGEEDWRDRVRKLLQLHGMSMKDASVAAGKGATWVRDILERAREPGINAFSALARALKTTVGYLLENKPEGAPAVRIVGYVGAGLEAHYYGEADDPNEFTDSPPNPTTNTVAVKVRGDSMAGLFDDGSILYYDDVRTPPTEDLIGRLCVVQLKDGKVLVKRLLKGSRRGRWNLLSTNADPLMDKTLAWAARVIWIKPA
jgi:phage repressor protein C with HTH and peptisase S24 domain